MIVFLVLILAVKNVVPEKNLCGCQPINDPVCASNGKTYPNKCSLLCDPDYPPDTLHVVHRGPCGVHPKDDSEEARISCGCQELDKPVCASNGHTYPSHCEMHCGSPHGHNVSQLTRLHSGPCTDDDSPPNCICPNYDDPVCGVTFKTYKNICQMGCDRDFPPGSIKPEYMGPCIVNNRRQSNRRNDEDNANCGCAPVNEPVCGTDGVTYANRCELKCINKETDVQNDGPCVDPKTDISCNCLPIRDLVCGSNFKTYQNLCELSCDTNYPRGYLKLLYRGKCQKEPDNDCNCPPINEPVCGSNYKTYPNPCELSCDPKYLPGDLTILYTGKCQKEPDNDCNCPPINEPVCGSNFKTYPNPCELSCDPKYLPGELTILYTGRCQKKPDNDCNCPPINEPVCGSNFKTYPNPCELSCDPKYLPGELTILYTGRCQKKPDNDCNCPPINEPVCGSNFKTYPNPCELSCDPKYLPGELTILYTGRCQKKPDNDCNCPPLNEPVCGSNYKTYANPCELSCDPKFLDGQLTILYNGRCQKKPDNDCKCPPLNEPVCGSNYKTYTNPCELSCDPEYLTGDLELLYNGRCQKEPDNNCNCSPINDPVCGTNYKTYPNVCELSCDPDYQYGKLKLLHKGSCNDPNTCFKCPTKYKPVCGSNFVTYDNLCKLSCDRKYQSGSIRLLYKGPCRPGPDPDTCNCPTYDDPVCGSNFITYQNVCKMKCERQYPPVRVLHKGPCQKEIDNNNVDCRCPPYNDPVCGSNHKTYANPCEVGCDRNYPPGYLKVLYKGICQEQVIVDPACRCPTYHDPVCGSNHITYDNTCEMECDTRYVPGSIKELYKGECQDTEIDQFCGCPTYDDPVCGSNKVTYQNTCKMGCDQRYASGSVHVLYKGPCKEEPNYDPCGCLPYEDHVCGSNHETYQNQCKMRCDRRYPPGFIKVLYRGPCQEDITVTNISETTGAACGCSRIDQPVCGSNGYTYPNLCQLRCSPPSVKLLHPGKCTEKDLAPLCGCAPYNDPVCGTNNVTYQNKCKMGCDRYYPPGSVKVLYKGPCKKESSPACECQTYDDPVCGSNYITYQNPCVLTCDRHYPPGSLTVLYKGPCYEGEGVENVTDRPNEINKDIVCGCKPKNLVVCGSDGKTYKNPCELRCGRPSNRVVYFGPCTESNVPHCSCPPYEDPVCGSNHKTYSNTCEMKCDRQYPPGSVDLLHYGTCRQDNESGSKCGCKPSDQPVCGSDGYTYPNPCELKCKPNNRVVHEGPCTEKDIGPFCGCPPIDEPVCGTNRKTYPNICEMGCDRLYPPGFVKVLYKGVCRPDTPVAPVTRLRSSCACPKIYYPVCSDLGYTFENECLAKCAVPLGTILHEGECTASDPKPLCGCPPINEPVCGTNQKTYPNRCVLGCDYNYMPGEVKVLYEGPCRDTIIGPLPKKRESCICPKNYAPVCSSIGFTYPNACMLKCLVPGSTIEHEGECRAQDVRFLCGCPPIKSPVCGTNLQTYPNTCEMGCDYHYMPGEIKILYEGPCKDYTRGRTCACPRILRPVCGGNGFTYSNDCLAKCLSGKNVLHEGKCTAADRAKVGPLCGCPPIGKPVCGTNYKTYPNKCEMGCDNEYMPGEIKVKHNGPCKDSTDQKFTKIAGGDCFCPRVYDPVCSIHGVTFPNECELKCGATTKEQTLAYEGPCDGDGSSVEPLTKLSSSNKNSENDDNLLSYKPKCACKKIKDPVCWGNGFTYSNDCEARCRAPKHKPQHKGECREGDRKPLCGCPPIDEPVCGTNQKTYPNKCQMGCDSQYMPGEITIQHKGSCKGKNGLGQVANAFKSKCACPKIENPVCWGNGYTYPNDCEAKCRAPNHKPQHPGECTEGDRKPLCGCPPIDEPVCGTNQKTYPNKCQMGCDSQYMPGEITIQHKGSCKGKNGLSQVANAFKSKCACSKIENPVCWGNGYTYPNDCEAKCRAPNHKPQHPGECTEGDRKPLCGCPPIDEPVCGTNQKTYPNKCQMGCDSQYMPGEITIQHKGSCKGKNGLDQVANAFKSKCACPKIENPVCWGNGYTYPNDCEAKCRAPNHKPQHPGECTEGDRKPLCGCPPIDEPVCGTNQKTYPNKCQMGCDSQYMPGEITIQHKGLCKGQVANAFKSKCACPKIKNPVCWSNGYTYPNDCEAKCRAPNHKPQHPGECTEGDRKPLCGCPPIDDPVCGTNQKTYPNTCAMGCDSQYMPGEITTEHKGPCNGNDEQPKCACPKIYKHVCSSNGYTYPNECEFNCRKKPNHRIRHNGKCNESDPKPLCGCPYLKEYVCGTNIKTYRNKCFMGCDPLHMPGEIKILHEGRCTSADKTENHDFNINKCDCGDDQSPVCASNYKTYKNKCAMECDHRYDNKELRVVFKGRCSEKLHHPFRSILENISLD